MMLADRLAKGLLSPPVPVRAFYNSVLHRAQPAAACRGTTALQASAQAMGAQI